MSANCDQRLTCADCGREFVWGAREQDFYKEKAIPFLMRRKSGNPAQLLYFQCRRAPQTLAAHLFGLPRRAASVPFSPMPRPPR